METPTFSFEPYTKICTKIFRPDKIFGPFKDFLTTLEQNMRGNFWAHIWKKHKIVLLTHSFSFSHNTFEWLKNEQIFCLKTFDLPVSIFPNIGFPKLIFIFDTFTLIEEFSRGKKHDFIYFTLSLKYEWSTMKYREVRVKYEWSTNEVRTPEVALFPPWYDRIWSWHYLFFIFWPRCA